MTSITDSFRRRIADAERVLPLGGDTPPQVRIRLDFLKEMLGEIDAEHERRMEQAIAATMGRGMLTADDVRDLIERHSDASCGNGRDFHNGAYVAIADELNATLGSYNCTNSERTETCKVDVLNTGDCAGYECSEYIMHCNGCGHEFGYVLYNEDGDVWMSEPPKYCPNCGRRIVDPTTNDVDAEVCE